MHSVNFYRPFLVTMFLLLVPVFGMIVSSEFNWNISDFLIMGLLIFFTGLTAEIIGVKITNKTYRFFIFFILLLAFLYIWAELAVGIFFNFGT